MKRIARWVCLPATCLLLAASLFGEASAQTGSAPAPPAGPTLVLPFRSVGVSDTTIFVSHDLLEGSLGDLGVRVQRASALNTPLPSGALACDLPECAAEIGRQHQAAQVVYGSLSKLGDKIIARISVVRVGETEPFYRDQLNALTEADLDKVMRRAAEGIAAGRPNSDRATVESVTQEEAATPARRATRSGLGFRAGFLFPSADSYGGSDRMTNFHFGYKYETPRFMIETTTLLGMTWGDENVDWTILDLAASRIFGAGDFATYLGAGVGVHTVKVHGKKWVVNDYPPYYHWEGWEGTDQTETVPTFDLVAGILSFRTYDFEIVTELRYHHCFEKFSKVGGDGAHGFLLTFGTSK